MTVKELIDNLKMCDPKAKVQYQDRYKTEVSDWVYCEDVKPEDIEDYGDTVRIGKLKQCISV